MSLNAQASCVHYFTVFNYNLMTIIIEKIEEPILIITMKLKNLFAIEPVREQVT